MKARDQRRKKKRQPPEPFRRKLHFLEDEVWSYRVGGSFVWIRTPDLKTTFEIPFTQITGMSWDDMERGQWKRWWDGIGPQQIKDYVEHHLRPDPAIELPPRVFVRLPPWGTRGETWHLRRECHFLPQETENPLFQAWRQVKAVSPEEAAEHFGEPLTRRNLCGLCMHHVYAREGATA